jgi:hypothetical protein
MVVMVPGETVVMARLVRAIYASASAATGGPDRPGHDEKGTAGDDVFRQC